MVWSSGCGEAFHEAAPSDGGSGKDATSDNPAIGDENASSDGVPTDTGLEGSTGDAACSKSSCGSCNHLCGSGGECISDVCSYPPFATGLVNPSGLAVDALGDVLVGINGDCSATTSGGSVRRYKSDGTVLSTIAAGIACDAFSGILVATNGFGAYWATSTSIGYATTTGVTGSSDPPSGRVVALAVDDGYAYIAVDSGTIYYAETTTSGLLGFTELTLNANAHVGAIASASGTKGTLYWADQCAATCTTSKSATGFIASSQVKFAPSVSMGPLDMNLPISMAFAHVVDELFWLDGTSAAVSETSTPVEPTATATTYPTSNPPLRIAADPGGTIFWTDNGGEVWIRRPGAPSNVLIGKNQMGAMAIAAAAKQVYWVLSGPSGSIGTSPW